MNDIERLIEATAENVSVVDAELPRQSFRIVGGADAAHVTVTEPAARVVEEVAVVSIHDGKYIATPVRDAPVEGYSINENGDDADDTRARVIALLGPDAYLPGSMWAQALVALDAGRSVMFVRGSKPVEVRGKKMFPVRIRG